MNKQTIVDALFGITVSLPAIRAALGERWPAFSNNLRAHAALFESPKDERALVAAVDRLIDIFRREERAYTIFLDSGAFEADDHRERETAEEVPIAVIADRYRQACADPDAFAPPPPRLNTRFEGIAPDQPLPVGQPVPLIVSVGAPATGGSSVPFSFTLDDATTSVAFTVYVHADPATWTIEVAEPTMIVALPDVTQQAARFLVTARRPAADKLYLTVERADTGATVQYVWLPVTAAPDDQPAGAGWRASLPFDSRDRQHHAVEISIEERGDRSSFLAVVRADLADGSRVRDTYVVPIDAAELRHHTYRLRHELETIIVHTDDDGKSYPFANFKELTAEEVVQRCAVLRRAAIPLADAGQQVWCRLFAGPRVPEGLKRLASALRELPHGSTIRLAIQSRQFILPWALLYDKPGEISEETIDWSGFWGYRYILDVLPPGTYRAPVIGCPPGIQVLLNDDDVLRKFTSHQERFFHNQLRAARSEICWGTKATWQALKMPSDAAIIYCYCHGTRLNSMEWPGPLPGDAMLIFGARDKGIRLADLERLELGALWNYPLVFLNACEAARPGGVFYEGFMSFFIEKRGARAFIGAEVDIPQSLAHHFALRFLQAFAQGLPVGEILWRLRRYYLDDQCTILAFNYSLYGLDELRLEQPIV